MKNISNRILIWFIIVMWFFIAYLYSLKNTIVNYSNNLDGNIHNNITNSNKGNKNYQDLSIDNIDIVNSGKNFIEDEIIEDEKIVIPDNLDEYFEYVLENWIEWEDYIKYELFDIPQIKYNNPEDNNNKIIYPYIKNNILHFQLPFTDKKWYIAFITKKKISKDRSLFLWINWSVVGSIRKEKSLSNKDNIYMYALSNIIMAWANWKWRNLCGDVKKSVLNINAYVWEKWNYLENIIIFFK